MQRSLFAVLLLLALDPLTAPSQVKDESAAMLFEAPANFVGDGCTMFPDGDYADCCFSHDRAYYRGGTSAERKAADRQLYRCVRDKGHKYLSGLMWVGVRIGGMGFLKTKFGWGFGSRDERKRRHLDALRDQPSTSTDVAAAPKTN